MAPDGKFAHTKYSVLATYEPALSATGSCCLDASILLSVRPVSGRMHQIRAHLASIGRALVADPAYSPERFEREVSLFPRVVLHCRRVALCDLTCNEFNAAAPLSPDIAAPLRLLSCLDRAD